MGERLGGRAKGTPNKAGQRVKEFFGSIFEEAFENPDYRQRLLNQVVAGTIDPKLLQTMLAYYAGRPAQAIDHTHSGTVTLARLIAGPLPSDDSEDDE